MNKILRLKIETEFGILYVQNIYKIFLKKYNIYNVWKVLENYNKFDKLHQFPYLDILIILKEKRFYHKGFS